MHQQMEKITKAEDRREISQVEERLARLKKLDLNQGTVSLWIVHRKLIRAKAQYAAFKIETEESLRNKLAKAVVKHVDKNDEVKPYEYITVDQDECFLEQPTGTTDFNEILELVNRNGEEFKVEQRQQLVDAWGYVVKLQIEDSIVYAFRKIGSGWSSSTSQSWLFKNRILVDLEDEPVFRADNKIDFIAYDGSVFILDKKSFEQAINFRDGMKRHRDEILAEFEEIDLVTNVEVIREYVNDNLHKLRKLASVKNNGFYRLPWYMERLKEINEREDWGLKINDEGMIETTLDNIELTLTLLNNDRLKSPITDETFDVPTKKVVAEAPAMA